MNYGLIRKTLVDSAAPVAAVVTGIVAFVVLFVWAMLNMGTELLTFVSQFSFLQRIFEMSLGIRVDGEVSVNILFAVCFTHLMVLGLSWYIVIGVTTRVFSGEVERGTADMLLSLPISRWNIYVSTTLVWITLSAIISFTPLAGIALGNAVFETDETVNITRFVLPAVNFLCLNLAVGGIGALAGTIFNRRGIADWNRGSGGLQFLCVELCRAICPTTFVHQLSEFAELLSPGRCG